MASTSMMVSTVGVFPRRRASKRLRSALARGWASIERFGFTVVHGGSPKVFVVGRNKTGTTTLKAVLTNMGFRIGNQAEAEILYHRHYFAGDFGPIIAYCRSAEAFQDVPFSARGVVPVLDEAFPGSRFILTVRASSDEWYESLTRFHASLFGTDGSPPTGAQLRVASYRIPGFMANLMRYYGTSDENPYDRRALIDDYEAHNASVRDYFRSDPERLLEVNVMDPDSLQRIEYFLGRSSGLSAMPHLNSSR